MLDERFWSKVTVGHPDECWLWMASTDRDGYGNFRDGLRFVGAHRWAYEHVVGPIPDGLELDHLCSVRHCVNPAHLEPVTHMENVRRSPLWHGNKTHCIHGHEFTPENTHIWNGRRVCRACGALATARYQERRRNLA